MSAPDEFPELTPLRRSHDFPSPSPERDERVTGAMDAALARQGDQNRSARPGAPGARRPPPGINPWILLAAAACMLLTCGLGLVAVRLALRESDIQIAAQADRDADAASPRPDKTVEIVLLKDSEVAEQLHQAAPGAPATPATPATTPAPFDAPKPSGAKLDDLQAHSPDGPIIALDRITDGSIEMVEDGGLVLYGTGHFYRRGSREFEGRQPDEKKTQTVDTWKRSNLVPNTSRLSIGDKEELPLKGMQFHVRLDGFRARVLIDAYFFNDRDRQFEGTFQLRLPDDASPWFFAFGETQFREKAGAPDRPLFYSFEEARRMGANPADIMHHRAATWGAPKEARMAPREKAAYAYRETVRKQVDPALMEWSGAGIFNARVFPLAPKKLHRVVIGYDVDLLSAGADLEYRLDLPESQAEIVVDLEVAEAAGVRAAVAPPADVVRHGGRAYYRFEPPRERTVTVRFAAPGPLMLAGADAKTGSYFAARFRPDLGAPPRAGAAADAPAGAGPADAIFLVDVSLSSNPERYNVWLKLLRAILDGNRDSICRFAVLFFNVETFWWKDGWTPNAPDAVAALIEFAGTLALEGASDLGAALGAGLRARRPRRRRWISSC
jgi:hypothetical protein